MDMTEWLNNNSQLLVEQDEDLQALGHREPVLVYRQRSRFQSEDCSPRALGMTRVDHSVQLSAHLSS